VAKNNQDESAETQTKKVIRREREVQIVLPELKAPKFMQGFVDFVREQGVVGWLSV
jgi:hypothetical protein